MGEYRTTTGEKPPHTGLEKRLRRRMGILLTLLAATLIYSIGHWGRVDRHAPASGYLTTGEYAEVRPAVAGHITEILISSGETVASNAVLARLEDSAQSAALEEAKRLTAKAAAELAWREAELTDQRRRHRQRLESARLTLEHARNRLKITRKLADMGLASGWELADQEYNEHMAESNYLLLKDLDETIDDRRLDVLRSELKVRQAAQERVEVDLEQRLIRAPITGRALRFTFHLGEVVRPDNVLYEIFGGEEYELRLRIPERYSNRVAVGQACRARFEGYPGWPRQWFHGRVAHLRNLIQTDAQSAYRVAYVTLDRTSLPLTPGATAKAEILIGRDSLWRHIFDQ